MRFAAPVFFASVLTLAVSDRLDRADDCWTCCCGGWRVEELISWDVLLGRVYFLRTQYPEYHVDAQMEAVVEDVGCSMRRKDTHLASMV